MVHDIRLIGIWSNLIGASVVFALLVGLDAGDDVPEGRLTEVLVLFGLSAGLGLTAAALMLERHARPAVQALGRDEPLVGDPRRVLLSIPLVNGLVTSLYWLGGGVIFASHSALRLGNSDTEAAALGAIIALGGLTTGTVVYLLLERSLRPIFALAFADEEPAPGEQFDVRHRLVLAWLLGSGIPLLISAVMVLDPEPSGLSSLRRTVLPWLFLGLIVGFAVTARVARSLAERLTALRDAMARVRRGELDIEVTVDDAAEVGMLQVGFNEMVTGLRERARLRDLFGRHVGEEVAQAALERGVSFEGEQAEASALFVDLVGSTRLATQRPATDVVGLLNEMFRAVVEAVEVEGGWVNKFEGDAALCVFGPPANHADHADRALRCARALGSELVSLREIHPELKVAIGVSSGPVVAGNVGSEARYEYTIVGDPVNVAARLTELAKGRPGLALASEDAIGRAGQDVGARWHPAGEELLRGRETPTKLYEPRASPAPAETGVEADAVR